MKRFPIQLPEELHDELKVQAIRAKMTLHDYILQHLQTLQNGNNDSKIPTTISRLEELISYLKNSVQVTKETTKVTKKVSNPTIQQSTTPKPTQTTCQAPKKKPISIGDEIVFEGGQDPYPVGEPWYCDHDADCNWMSQYNKDLTPEENIAIFQEHLRSHTSRGRRRRIADYTDYNPS